MPPSESEQQKLLEQLIRGQIDQATYERRLATLAQPPGHSAVGPAGGPQTRAGLTGARTGLGLPEDIIHSGNLLDGRFKVRDRLGKGGMGEVWRAYDTVADVQVVVKVLPRALQNDPQEIARVQQAFRRVNPLQHQHICPVHHLAHDPQAGYFLVMKFIDGTTLRDYLRATARGGRLPLAEVCRLLRPVADALDYAHNCGVVHRDIKPDNIMLSREGTDPQIVDFGLAADAHAAGTTSGAADRAGTLPYLAPEQWLKQHAGPASDQYALGIVAYELLGGRLPFSQRDPQLMKQQVLATPAPPLPGLPASTQACLARALSKRPEDRYPSCGEFLRSLERQTGAPPPMSPPAGRSGEIPMIPVAPSPAPIGSAPKTGTETEIPYLSPPSRVTSRPPLAVAPPARLNSAPLAAPPPPAPIEGAVAPMSDSPRPRSRAWIGWIGLAIGLTGVTVAIVQRESEAPPKATPTAVPTPNVLSRSSPSPTPVAVERVERASLRPPASASAERPPPSLATPERSPDRLPLATPPSSDLAAPRYVPSAPRRIIGRTQLLNAFVPFGLTLENLRGAEIVTQSGSAVVELDAAGLVVGISYQAGAGGEKSDEIAVTMNRPRKEPCVLTIRIDVHPEHGPVATASSLKVLSDAGADSRAAATVATTTALPEMRKPVRVERSGAERLASTWGEESHLLSASLGRLRPVVRPLASSGTRWMPMIPYSDDEGHPRCEFALYAPDELSLSLQRADTSMTISEYSPLLASHQHLLQVHWDEEAGGLLTKPLKRLPAELSTAIDRCLIRIAGTQDQVVLLRPPVDVDARLQVFWKMPRQIPVPGSLPEGLRYRLFLQWRPWNAPAEEWVEVPRGGAAGGANSLRFIYDRDEPQDWDRNFGAWEFAVHLRDLVFQLDVTGSWEAPQAFTIQVQGVAAGWIESYRLKRTALRDARPAEQRQLNYELQILEALISDRAGSLGPGKGFAACLIGYETLTGPRGIRDPGATIDRGDRIEVARCLFGRNLEELPPALLVLPGSETVEAP